MKKLLLAGVAALSVLSASAAHFTEKITTMPTHFIGDWCFNNVEQNVTNYQLPSWAEDGQCTKNKINSINEYGFYNLDKSCDPEQVQLAKDPAHTGIAYVAVITARCSANGLEEVRTFRFSRYKGNLYIATKWPEDNGSHFCVSVIEPPPDVTKDPEYKEDEWLGVRKGPGKQFKIITKVGDYKFLEADDVQGDWIHVSVTSPENYDKEPIQGWVRSKHVKKFPCSEFEPEPVPPTPTQEEPEPKCDIPGCDQ